MPRGLTLQPPALHATQHKGTTGNGGEGRCEEEGVGGGETKEAEEEEPPTVEEKLKASFFNA